MFHVYCESCIGVCFTFMIHPLGFDLDKLQLFQLCFACKVKLCMILDNLEHQVDQLNIFYNILVSCCFTHLMDGILYMVNSCCLCELF